MLNVRIRRHATVFAVTATAAASWAVVTQLAGVHLGVQLPHSAPSTLGLGRTVAVASAAAGIGTAVLAMAERHLSRPRRSWITAAVAALVASLILPLGFATSASAMVSLVAIHLAVAAVTVAGLAPTASTRKLAMSGSVRARLVPPAA